jgi:hypothetical protein
MQPYLFNRYVWGIVFLVAMALLVLFVPGDEPDRLGFVQSSFLGIVSWQFILVSSTPVTGYNTKLDNFVLVSMCVVFCVYFWNSVRIGFFDWLEKKHAHLLGDGEEESAAAGGSSSSSAKVVPDAAAAEAGGAVTQQPKKGRMKIHPLFRLFWCVCTASRAAPRIQYLWPILTTPCPHTRKIPSLFPFHSNKCGEDSLHWYADSAAGTILSIAFAAACAAILTARAE